MALHTLLRELIEPCRETVPWELVACILTIARFCGNKSELEVAERWYDDSALADLLGVPFAAIHHTRLYRGLDVLHAHKDRLCQHLLARYESWFGVEFEFLLHDVTSTCFEGKAEANTKAARGYSCDQRPDCKQVNIGLVCTPEGLPIAYEVFAGNTTDVRTVEDMVEMMEQKYGQARRIWVMDRGMVSEDNIDFLRERKARYIVGTPKQQLRQFESQLLDQSNWTEVQPGIEVKLAPIPMAKAASNTCSAAPVSGARKKLPCLNNNTSACGRSWTKPMRACASAPPRIPGALSGASAAGSGAIPVPRSSSTFTSNSMPRAAPALCR